MFAVGWTSGARRGWLVLSSALASPEGVGETLELRSLTHSYPFCFAKMSPRLGLGTRAIFLVTRVRRVCRPWHLPWRGQAPGG